MLRLIKYDTKLYIIWFNASNNKNALVVNTNINTSTSNYLITISELYKVCLGFFIIKIKTEFHIQQGWQ